MCRLGDKDAVHIKLYVALALWLEQIERLGAGHEQEARMIKRPFHTVVHHMPRRVKSVRVVAVGGRFVNQITGPTKRPALIQLFRLKLCRLSETTNIAPAKLGQGRVWLTLYQFTSFFL